jgi:hypothetical protein
VVAGIAGALLAVPLLAVLNSGVRSLLHEEDPDPAAVDVLHDQNAAPNTDPDDNSDNEDREDKADSKNGEGASNRA